MEVVASLSQGRTTAAQCGLFTYISVPVIFQPPFKFYTFVNLIFEVTECISIRIRTRVLNCALAGELFLSASVKHSLDYMKLNLSSFIHKHVTV